ncbi:MAG: hypothetical protein ACJ8J0_22855 [Longimicrobiaceae bacterium]
MLRRLNLLALAVIAGGGALLATPAPARATYYDARKVFESCCVATDTFGHVIYRCCWYTGCVVSAAGCTRL